MIKCFGQHWCPWSQKAKALCEEYPTMARYYEIDPTNQRQEEALRKATGGATTIPLTFNKNNEYVGGYDALVALLNVPMKSHDIQRAWKSLPAAW